MGWVLDDAKRFTKTKYFWWVVTVGTGRLTARDLHDKQKYSWWVILWGV